MEGGLIFALIVSRTACLFLSILIHELGHAFVIRWAGFRPEVVLHAFGGYAVYQPHRHIRPWEQVLISLAGPGAGFVLCGLTFAVAILLAVRGIPLSFVAGDAIAQLIYINFYWGIVNLLPVIPLDGGQISRAILQGYWGLGGLRFAFLVSIIFAGLTAWYFAQVLNQGVFSFPVILFAMLCFESIQAYQQLRGYR